MTKAEAIDIIKVAIGEVEWEYPLEITTALDMAVEALEMKEDDKQNVETKKSSVQHTYMAVANCRKCGSTDLAYKTIFTAPATYQLRVICLDCGFNEAIAANENLEKRSSSKLTKWANEVKAKYGYKCHICGSTVELEAHHIIAVKDDVNMEYKFNVNNGICLCRSCHNKVHSWKETRYGKAQTEGKHDEA